MSEFVELATITPPNENDPKTMRRAVARLGNAVEFAAAHLPRIFYAACPAGSTTNVIADVPQKYRVADVWIVQTDALAGGGDTAQLRRKRQGTTVNLTDAIPMTAATDRVLTHTPGIYSGAHDLWNGDLIDCVTVGTGAAIAYILCVPNG